MAENNRQTLQETAFDSMEFRRALGSYPTGVTIITTRGPDGEPVGLTCNSFSSVSLDPPLVLWSLRKSSKSLPVFQEARDFAINLLAEEQIALSARFASGRITNKFEGVSYQQSATGLPLIDGCLARFHCSLFAEHEAGDHVIFIGKVERFENAKKDDPLVFYNGAYMTLAQSLREIATEGRVSTAALIEARVSVYGSLLKLACLNGTDEDFNALEAHLQEMDELEAQGDMATRGHAALDFFHLIARAAHNEVLVIVAQSLAKLMHHAVDVQAASLSWLTMHQPELVKIRYQMVEGLRARDTTQAMAAFDAYFEEVRRFQNKLQKEAEDD